MVEIFSAAEFEAALPKAKVTGTSLCESRGLVDGEYTYFMPITKHAGAVIRSSVKSDGWSARSGKDSIRIWLVDPKTDLPVSNKLSHHITRTTGWQHRLVSQLRIYYRLGRHVRPCECGGMIKVGQAHNPQNPENKGLFYASCSISSREHFCTTTPFHWLMDIKK